MKKGRKIIQSIMLLCSFVLLLSVIVPHHHHCDGRACYKPLKEMAADATSHDGDAHTSCCDGHNLFHHSIHSADSDLGFLPVLLLILFDYINPHITVSCKQIFGGEEAVYIESLHGVWIAEASGLRAPPCL